LPLHVPLPRSAPVVRRTEKAAKASSEYAELYFPGVSSGKLLTKRVKNLQKKAMQIEDPLLPKKYVQKGWPRGYEFGTHRMTRKLRSSELVYAESGNDSSSGFAW
jgi:hypothetical protein